ncbi:glycosyltransferase [Actinosynnema sp. NPDC023794]
MFAALAAHGHTYPSIPLALAARDAGHDVVFAAGEPFLPALREAGLRAVPAGMGMAEAFAGVEPTERGIGHVIGDVLPRRWFADLTPLLRVHRPELLVHDLATLGAALAGAAAGVPTIAHTFGRVSPGPMSAAMVASFDALAAELGVTPPPARSVDICPDSVQSPQFRATDRVPLRPVGWSRPGDVPERGSRPFVYLTLGTAYASTDVLRQAVDGLAALPVDVVVATGPVVDVAALGPAPDNVRLTAWAPQHRLLRVVDLVVHHGGSGTMLGAFAAGVPQLLLPQGADQFTNAQAVLDAGAGARLLPDELSREAVTAAAGALLVDDAARAGARRLAIEIATMPSPAEVVDRLT